MQVVGGEGPFGDCATWHRVTGSLAVGMTPLVMAHGGPGRAHDDVDSFKDLAARGRALIHDDRIGNGRSTHPPDRGADVRTVEFFLSELDNLLGLRRPYHRLGPSWGGTRGADHDQD